ncbi:hypothetical protein FE257_011244 [Aspergillus nanangensis]|uniref:Histone H3 n=1 Tax=Aspergillus nanangensis TaxID=2582783 RepID=A0AAD4GQQ8_ASPNN|nr:hypothetical protein FE257_011244 [Aspergillus nanangensis]
MGSPKSTKKKATSRVKSRKKKPAKSKTQNKVSTTSTNLVRTKSKKDLMTHIQRGGKTDSKSAKPKKKQRQSTEKPQFILNKARFARLVRQIGVSVSSTGHIRFRKTAIEALQEASEEMLMKELAMGQLTAAHAGRATIQQRDMRYIQSIRDIMEGKAVSDFAVE